MASTITVQDDISWAKSYIEQQPVLVNGMEPALGSANLILQTVLGPPFSWPWNRAILSYTTSDQDVTQAGLNDFGFLEGGTVQSVDGGKPWEIAVKNLLHLDQSHARPAFCSPLIDDGQGNITFRLTPAPDQAYLTTLIYQKKARTIMSIGTAWLPIPDEKHYIPRWGFLAMMSLIGNDARFNEYNAKFLTALLAAQGGLTEMERNIFLANWLRVLSQMQGGQLGTTERYKARET